MCTDVSDGELLAAFRRGEASALEQLIERYLPAVWKLASQLMLNRTQADDLAQEAFLRAIRGLAGFRGDSQFRTWLFRIVVNVSRDMYESNQRGAGELLNPAFDPADHAHHGPERVVMQTEMEQCLADAVTRLPLSLRRAIVLTTLNDFSPQEVAEMEACSVNTIYSRIHEARKLLRKQLEPWFP